jgi:DNA topoisomerase VI subunit B
MTTDRPAVSRTTFTTSRLSEFASRKELVAQTGHAVEDWPLVVLKEAVDNSLDNCEEAGVAPEIKISVTDGDGDRDANIVVADNGAGIPAETVRRVRDFHMRVSSREAYAAPDRGAQGNALKTLVAMPYVLDGKARRVTIEAHGIAHQIAFRTDPIRREPVIEHAEEPSLVRTGTRVTVHWPSSACSYLKAARPRFLQIADDFAWLNPHLSLDVTWNAVRAVSVRASSASWAKWRPSEPTSPHWYTPERLERLMAAYIGHDLDNKRDRPVREFIAGFRGLTATAKQKVVLDATGLSRSPLSSLCSKDGFDRPKVFALLEAMKAASAPVKPTVLGIIGKDHVAQCFEAAGAHPETLKYQRALGMTGDLPWIAEVAFGYCPEAEARRFVVGVNWSAAIANPFRELISHGEGLETILSDQRVTADEPVIVFVHLTIPRPEYRDRGKSTIVVPFVASAFKHPDIVSNVGPADAIVAAVRSVTAAWAKQCKAEERDWSRRQLRNERMLRARRVTVKDAAFAVMEKAYLTASANDTLPAHARQIMYQARPEIQAATGRQLDDDYFTQTLLPDFITERGVAWNVAYDERGHLTEPRGKTIGLGTLSVRRYLGGIALPSFSGYGVSTPELITHGPSGSFGGILFNEKEGFLPLFQHVELFERWDLAAMSTKGQSVTAARQLVEALCSGVGSIPLLVLHDFDKSGFSILATLQRATRRYRFKHAPRVIDLGLRLADVEEMGLEGEAVYDRGSAEARAANLRRNGANEREIEYLLHRRVELNALTSDQLVAFVERKLEQHGIKKVMPDPKLLGDCYRFTIEGKAVREAAEKAIEEAEAAADQVDIPDDLAERVAAHLKEHPTDRWDDAVAEIAEETPPIIDETQAVAGAWLTRIYAGLGMTGERS